MEEKAGKAKMCVSEYIIAYTYLIITRCVLYKELINLLPKMRFIVVYPDCMHSCCDFLYSNPAFDLTISAVCYLDSLRLQSAVASICYKYVFCISYTDLRIYVHT